VRKLTPEPTPELARALGVPAAGLPDVIARAGALETDAAAALGRAYAVLLERRRERLVAQQPQDN
jgi:hypothetical protein